MQFCFIYYNKNYINTEVIGSQQTCLYRSLCLRKYLQFLGFYIAQLSTFYWNTEQNHLGSALLLASPCVKICV